MNMKDEVCDKCNLDSNGYTKRQLTLNIMLTRKGLDNIHLLRSISSDGREYRWGSVVVNSDLYLNVYRDCRSRSSVTYCRSIKYWQFQLSLWYRNSYLITGYDLGRTTWAPFMNEVEGKKSKILAYPLDIIRIDYLYESSVWPFSGTYNLHRPPYTLGYHWVGARGSDRADP